MSMNPLVSIIIPVYNSAAFLPKCLENVCGQTLCDIEIICVNDASTDDSFSMLRDYANKDERIKIINLQENKGAAVARNIAVESARGQYLGFVDADDFIDKNFYEKLVERAVKTNADVVKGNLMIYCPTTKTAKKEAWIDINEDARRHKANFYFLFYSAIYKTSIIKENSVKFLEGLIHFEDPYFTIKAALFYQKLEVIDDVFYYYVNNPNSISRHKVGIKHVESLISGANATLDLLDKYCDEKDHYIIVFNFLTEQFLGWCNRVDISDEATAKAANGLADLYERCKYKGECSEYHFLRKKKI